MTTIGRLHIPNIYWTEPLGDLSPAGSSGPGTPQFVPGFAGHSSPPSAFPAPEIKVPQTTFPGDG